MRAGGEFYILDTKFRLSSCLRVSPLSTNDERELTEPETSVGVTLVPTLHPELLDIYVIHNLNQIIWNIWNIVSSLNMKSVPNVSLPQYLAEMQMGVMRPSRSTTVSWRISALLFFCLLLYLESTSN